MNRSPRSLIAVLALAFAAGCGTASEGSKVPEPTPAASGPSSPTEQTESADFEPESFDALIPAVSKAFTTLTSGTKAPQEAVHKLKGQINVTTFDEAGAWQEDGRFGLFLRPGSTTICVSDFQENVSFAIWWDHDQSDGRSAKVLAFDWSNCKTERYRSGERKAPHVWVDRTSVRAADTIASEKAIYDHLAELIEGNTVLVNIRAHFL